MKNSFIYSALVAIIIATSFTFCGGVSSNTPGKAVLKFYDSMKSKDFQKSASLFVTKDNKELSESESKKIEGLLGMSYAKYEEKGGIDKVIINEETISKDGNSAKVKFTIHFKNGETDDERMSSIKVDGKWRFQISNR